MTHALDSTPWQRAFVRYVRGTDHPAKLRIVRWLEGAFFRTLIADTESGVMKLDSRDLIQNALLHYGHFEPETFRAHRRILAPGDVYVDLGANCGAFTLLGAQLVGASGRVLSMEPNPAIFARLLQNLSFNAFSANVTPFLCAASSEDGFAYLAAPPDSNSGTARLIEQRQDNAFLVPTRRLSGVLAFAGVSRVKLLKIDVEGHEPPVLRDLFASGPRPDNILIEYMPEDFPSHAVVPDLLRGAGYELCTLEGAPFDPASPAHENNIWARRR